MPTINMAKGHFRHITDGREKNDLGFLMVMVVGLETMTKSLSHGT